MATRPQHAELMAKTASRRGLACFIIGGFAMSLGLAQAQSAGEPDASLPLDGGAGATVPPGDGGVSRSGEDSLLTDYKRYEHRDERTPGRGPQGRKIGFGFSLGRPVGVGVKIFFTQTVAFQADVGVSYSWYGPELDATGQVVWHPSQLLTYDAVKVNWYIGLGARAAGWPAVVVGIPAWLPTCKTPSTEIDAYRECRRPALTYIPSGDTFPGTLGITAPVVGISLQLQALPLELFGQAAPVIELFPALSADVTFQLGARWYFF
jgi:hypothetical protein